MSCGAGKWFELLGDMLWGEGVRQGEGDERERFEESGSTRLGEYMLRWYCGSSGFGR